MELEKSIQELKEQLSQLNIEKEKYFREKENFKKQILFIIGDVKKIKSEKDKSSISLKDLKESRDMHNRKVKELIEKIKKINEQKRELSKKYNLREDPSMIKEQINSLDLKVETEALTLNKEKQVMREIKELKKKYEKLGEVTKVIDEYSTVSKDIEENKKKAEEFHKQIKEITKDIDYSQFMEKSNEIESLKKKQQESTGSITIQGC